jgi:hypothetical protein
MAAGLLPDLAPANTILIAPATDVTFAAWADLSPTISNQTTTSPVTNQTSSAQQASPLSASTTTAAPTATPTPADLVFQSGFTDLYASPINDAQFADSLQAAPSASSTYSSAAAVPASGGAGPAMSSPASRSSGMSSMVRRLQVCSDQADKLHRTICRKASAPSGAVRRLSSIQCRPAATSPFRAASRPRSKSSPADCFCDCRFSDSAASRATWATPLLPAE